ncbi:MAG: hypothetical protein MJ152_00305 [Clostridia bacterium]|nr:hypothetical protein [Clostridia bacterium]
MTNDTYKKLLECSDEEIFNRYLINTENNKYNEKEFRAKFATEYKSLLPGGTQNENCQILQQLNIPDLGYYRTSLVKNVAVQFLEYKVNLKSLLLDFDKILSEHPSIVRASLASKEKNETKQVTPEIKKLVDDYVANVVKNKCLSHLKELEEKQQL